MLGSVKMRCYLSGMPELRLGLNDKVMFEATGRGGSATKAIEMEDVKFHQCVRLSRFENDRTISFIPPDGDFELMSYRLQTTVKPLIWVEAVVETYSGSRVEYLVKAKAQFKRKSTANNVEIEVPVPDDADTPKFKVREPYYACTLSIYKTKKNSQAVDLFHINQKGHALCGKLNSSREEKSSLCVLTLVCHLFKQPMSQKRNHLSISNLKFLTLQSQASRLDI